MDPGTGMTPGCKRWHPTTSAIVKCWKTREGFCGVVRARRQAQQPRRYRLALPLQRSRPLRRGDRRPRRARHRAGHPDRRRQAGRPRQRALPPGRGRQAPALAHLHRAQPGAPALSHEPGAALRRAAARPAVRQLSRPRLRHGAARGWPAAQRRGHRVLHAGRGLALQRPHAAQLHQPQLLAGGQAPRAHRHQRLRPAGGAAPARRGSHQPQLQHRHHARHAALHRGAPARPASRWRSPSRSTPTCPTCRARPRWT